MKIARLFGIDILLDLSTLILALIVGHSSFVRFSRVFPNENNTNLILASTMVCIGILISILLHELGHAIIGKICGIKFNKIVLHVLGGTAVMDSAIKNPNSEFKMAVAGPLVSLFLGLVFLLLLPLTTVNNQITLNTLTVFNLCATNFVLGIFNMLPAFPLDGGRVLRATIWKYTKDFIKATTFAVDIGRYFGIGLICSGFLMCFGVEVPLFGTGVGNGIWTAVMGLFISLAGAQELKAAKKLNEADVVERNTRES